MKPLHSFLPKDNTKSLRILGLSQTVGMRSGLVALAPGDDVGAHSTENNEELLIILDGKGRLEIESSGIEVSANETVYIPPNTRHNVLNTGSTPLRYIYVVTQVRG